jgi:Kef-type K+ transport system membrane component KefB
MIAASVGVYFLVRALGDGLTAPVPTEGARGPGPVAHSNLFAHLLLALAVVTLLARFMGGVFRRYLKQPPVIGEIVAGLMLGPSLLGAISPEIYQAVMPDAMAPHLGVVSKIGVVLFMFLVGLELDTKLLRGNTHAMIAISHASIVVPFLLGALLALGLYPLYSTRDVSFTVFSLFLAVSLSVTAFPVLARILIDRRVHHTRLGATALACAAVGDVTAWVLLALVAGIATAQVIGAAWTLAWVVGYVGLMFVVVKPLISRFAAFQETRCTLGHTPLAIVFVALLLSAFATEAIGIHALFGAFLLGSMLPHEGKLADGIRARLEDVVIVLFLPSFFAFTGMRTQIGLVNTAQDWIVCGLILLVATLGKFGGTFLAARLTGLNTRRSAALGILMNTRGLMELIVLNLGLDLGVISPTVFTMLVLMALITTFMTTPILDALLSRRGFSDAPAAETSPEAQRRAG